MDKYRDRSQDPAMLALLVKQMPLKDVLSITAAILADRGDLDGVRMQEFQRKIADMTWPLISVDEDLRRENVIATSQWTG